MEGIATVSFDSSVQNGLQIIDEDYDHLSLTDELEGGSRTGFPQRWSGRSSQTSDLDVVCTNYGFQVTFLMSPLSEVKVLGMLLSTTPQDINILWANLQSCILWSPLGPKELLPVVDAPVSCGYEVNIPENVLIVPLTGCHVNHLATCNVSMELWLVLFLPLWIIHPQIMESLQASTYSLQFLYINKFGQHKVATAICEEEIQLSPRMGGNQGKCIPKDPTVAPTTPTPAHTTVALPIPNLNGKCDCSLGCLVSQQMYASIIKSN